MEIVIDLISFCLECFLENPEAPVATSTQKEQQQDNEIVDDFVFFKADTDIIIAKGQEMKPDDQIKLNGDAIVSEINGEADQTEESVRTSNGAEAYENLVKSLTDDYMKEMDEETIDENFSIMESNIIDFTSQSGLF